MPKNRTDSGIGLPWKALFYTHIVKWIEMLLFCAPDQWLDYKISWPCFKDFSQETKS